MSFSRLKMLYLCVNAQDDRTTIKLHDIKFRKTNKFKCLKAIIPDDDNYGSEIKKKCTGQCGWGKDYCRNMQLKRYWLK